MKLLKKISVLVAFLLICSGAIAQQQCALKLTDQTPGGPYTARVRVFYNGVLESTGLTYTVAVNAINLIPFSLQHDVAADAYRIVVEVKENGTTVGYPYSSPFSTDDWFYNNINVQFALQ